jgi:GGDEF domain-containing protein
VVFLLGLLLVGFFSTVLRQVRRQLDAQRDRAVHDSLHDSLTGWPTGGLLTDRFDQALRARHRVTVRYGLAIEARRRRRGDP